RPAEKANARLLAAAKPRFLADCRKRTWGKCCCSISPQPSWEALSITRTSKLTSDSSEKMLATQARRCSAEFQLTMMIESSGWELIVCSVTTYAHEAASAAAVFVWAPRRLCIVSTTRVCCAAVRWGYMGRESTSDASRSETGKSPALYPRRRNAA